jgi:hypothetical protein
VDRAAAGQIALAWHLGGSHMDIAELSADNRAWGQRVVSYFPKGR